MKMNKNTFESRLASLTTAPCRKMAMDNIVLPQFLDMGIAYYIYQHSVHTAEQPEGCYYDPHKFQAVLRVLDGHVLFDDPRRVSHNGKRADTYCWSTEKVMNLVTKGKTKPIGTNSPQGLLNLMALFSTIQSEEEKELVAQTFAFCNQDMLLAHTDAEDRMYVRITQELYDAGWTACVDEWMDVDGNGEADATELFVGDVLIINIKPNGERSAYRIDHDMFEETHTY